METNVEYDEQIVLEKGMGTTTTHTYTNPK